MMWSFGKVMVQPEQRGGLRVAMWDNRPMEFTCGSDGFGLSGSDDCCESRESSNGQIRPRACEEQSLLR